MSVRALPSGTTQPSSIEPLSSTNMLSAGLIGAAAMTTLTSLCSRVGHEVGASMSGLWRDIRVTREFSAARWSNRSYTIAIYTTGALFLLGMALLDWSARSQDR